MKNILILLFCIAWNFATAQENANRIEEINKEIKIALLEEDYQQAADLKAEKLILIEIDKALLNKDYQRAADLKEQLETGKVTVKNKSKSTISSDFSYESLILKNGFLVGFNLGGGTAASGNNNKVALGSVGAVIAYRMYFGKSNFYRPGIQLTGLNASIIYNIPSEYVGASLAPLNIGISNLFEFKQDIGAEVNVNLGYNIILNITDNFSTRDFLIHGMRVNPQFKFRYKQNAIGFDANIINNFYDVRGGIATDLYGVYSISYGRTF